MKEQPAEVREVLLKPGEFHFARSNTRISTLLAEQVGGSGRRKLHFDLWSGDVWLAFPQGSNARIRSAHG
jgi:hypothetical protein